MNDSHLPFSRANVRRDERYFSNQFAIIGNAASGKTALATRLGWAFPKPLEHLSAGGLMREIAKSAGQSMTVFAKHMCDHPGQGPDDFVDRQVRKHMSQNWRSLDAHLPVFAPHAFLIYLKCPWHVCAERRASQKGKPVSVVLTELMDRDQADQRKYALIYPGSNWLETDFDFVVDTDRNSEERTFSIVLEAYELWLHCHRSRIITEGAMPLKVCV